DIFQAQRVGEFRVGGNDTVVNALIVVDQIHLVDGHDHVLDLQQVRNGRVALGLDQQVHAAVVVQLHFRYVDQDDDGIGGRGAGHHVACVLLVAWRIGDDELA